MAVERHFGKHPAPGVSYAIFDDIGVPLVS